MAKPKRMTLLCWAILLIWLMPSLWLNVPKTALMLYGKTNQLNIVAAAGMIVVGPTVYPFGWPLPYGEVSRTPNKPDQISYKLGFLSFNLIAIAATLWCLVYFVQTAAPRTKIIHLIILTAFIGLLIASIQHAFYSPSPIVKKMPVVIAFYFCPIFLAAVVYSLKMHRNDTEI